MNNDRAKGRLPLYPGFCIGGETKTLWRLCGAALTKSQAKPLKEGAIEFAESCANPPPVTLMSQDFPTFRVISAESCNGHLARRLIPVSLER